MARPFKFTDIKQLEELIDSYFIECDEKKDPYTVTGLAIWLKCDKDTVLNYKKREDEMEDYSALIKTAYLRIENFAEKRLYASSGVVAGPIFALKNFGWKDQKQTDMTLKTISPILGGTTDAIHSDNSDEEASKAD